MANTGDNFSFGNNAAIPSTSLGYKRKRPLDTWNLASDPTHQQTTQFNVNQTGSAPLLFLNPQGAISTAYSQSVTTPAEGLENLETLAFASELLKLQESSTGRQDAVFGSYTRNETATSTMDRSHAYLLPPSSTVTSDFADINGSALQDALANFVCYTNVPMSREALTKQRTDDLMHRQKRMEKRCDTLLRRVRVLQARKVAKSTTKELGNFVAYAQTALSQPGTRNEWPVSGSLDKNDVKGMSTADLVNLVRQMEMANGQNQSAAFGMILQDRQRALRLSETCKLKPHVCRQVADAVGHLQNSVQFMDSAFDSDATMSSSGSESGGESEYDMSEEPPYMKVLPMFKKPEAQAKDETGAASTNPDASGASGTNGHPANKSDRYKHPAWEWLKDRAAISARWTWLEAQVSDLEYKIRQHNSLLLDIRKAKGDIMFGDVPSATVTNQPKVVNRIQHLVLGDGKTLECSDISVLDEGAARSSSTDSSHAPSNETIDAGYEGGDETCVASRTRPLGKFNKRKLIQPIGLHLLSKKASRPSHLNCTCVQPNKWCMICTGRFEPRGLIEDCRRPATVAAYVDPCYHYVLSLPDACPLSVRMNTQLHLGSWLQKNTRPSKKQMKSYVKSPQRPAASRNNKTKKSQKDMEQKRKYTSRLKKAALNNKLRRISPTKKGPDILQKARKRALPGKQDQSKKKQKTGEHKSSRDSESRGDGDGAFGSDTEDCLNASASKNASPEGSPVPDGSVPRKEKNSLLHDLLRRKRENSYDIDNIVIPYSIAATTRVEKLQYKEILTPKWRLIEDMVDNPDIKSEPKCSDPSQKLSSTDNDFEDISDEAYQIRHERCEQDERRKFFSFMPHQSIRGRQRRTDSRAESSGANTPDPLSPGVPELQAETNSPLQSPPGTPMLITDDNSQPGTVLSGISNVPASRDRRRHSICRTKEKESSRSTTPDHVEVTPYEPFVFPLSDSIYEEMVKEMPPDHFTPLCSPKKQSSLPGSKQTSRLSSPTTDSTESALEDDPNDPEWTLATAKDEQPRKQSTGPKASRK